MRRRRFVAAIGSCAGYLAASLAAGGATSRRLFAARPRGRVVAREPWGRLEQLGEGVWALVSTPLNDHPRASLTVANGGIVAGRDGVVLIEGLVSEDGARWMAQAAEELTGRPPDHVILTHYHGDHSSGLAAYGPDGRATLHAAPTTLESLRGSAERQGRAAVTADFSGERLRRVEETGSTWLDLGGRRLEILPASGHTDSDLVVSLEEPRIVWCGDLVWNGIVPNYMDATPTRLSESVRRVAAAPAETWVPGHGELADAGAMRRYVALIDDIEAAARRGFDAGDAPESSAAAYRPPAALGEWTLFGARYYETAFRAWHRELGE